MKQKVLLCWNYERQSWVDHFERIFNKDEYVFLNFFSRVQEKQSFSQVPVYYWENFTDIDAVIAALQPTRVVFMGLEGPYNMLLNYLCRKKGIPTFLLQHGIFHSYEAYQYEEKAMKRIAGESIIPLHKASSLSNKRNFLTRSFSLQRLPIFARILAFLFIKSFTHSTQRSLRFIAGEMVQTDFYVVYTRYLSRIYVERDKVPAHKFLEIGNPEASRVIDEILKIPGYHFSGGDYYLFIDEAFAGSSEQNLLPIVPVKEYNDFLVTLSDYAQSKGKKLKVKLHPFSYSENHFVSHPNMELVKEADIVALIAHCKGVFGFSSTLLIPALFVKSACIFRLNEFSHIHKALMKMNYCKVLDFHSFTPEQIEFWEHRPLQEAEFIRYFIFKMDNNYLERLSLALHTNSVAL